MKNLLSISFVFLLSINVFAQWSDLGSGLNGRPTRAVVYKDKLYVIGEFTVAGGTTITNGIASWDGTKWENITGLGGIEPYSSLFFVQGDNLYMVKFGYSNFSRFQVNGVESNYGMVKFDGNKWYEVALIQTELDINNSTPQTYRLNVKPILSSTRDNIWNAPPAITNDKVLFVGKDENDAPYFATFANDKFSILFDTSHFSNLKYNISDKFVEFGGTGVGTQNGYFVNCTYTTIAFGSTSNRNATYEFGLDGIKVKLESSSPFLMTNYNNEVYMITNSAGTLSLPTSHIAKWVPSDYMYVPVAVQKDSINQAGIRFMTVYNNQLWLTGAFKRAGQQLVNSMIAWDGNKWITAEGGVKNNISGFTTAYIYFAIEYKGELVVGGDIGVAGTKAVNRIAKYKAIPNGIEDETSFNSTFQLYPNPAQNEVLLTSQSPISGIFSFFNLQGQQVLEQNITGTQTKISLVNLPQGIYQYELKDTNGKSEKGKLVVQ
jgi:hypothetical protein